MTSTGTPPSKKTCTCDDKFIVFMNSEYFEGILKGAIQNVMGDIIRNILEHQIKDDLCTIIRKTEQIELDLKKITSKLGVSNERNSIKGENNKKQCKDDLQNQCENRDDEEDSSDSSNDNISRDSFNETAVGIEKNNDHGMYSTVLINN